MPIEQVRFVVVMLWNSSFQKCFSLPRLVICSKVTSQIVTETQPTAPPISYKREDQNHSLSLSLFLIYLMKLNFQPQTWSPTFISFFFISQLCIALKMTFHAYEDVSVSNAFWLIDYRNSVMQSISYQKKRASLVSHLVFDGNVRVFVCCL